MLNQKNAAKLIAALFLMGGLSVAFAATPDTSPDTTTASACGQQV